MYFAYLNYPNIDPVIFHVGPLAVRWYGLMYVVGFVLAFFLIRSYVNFHKIKLSTNDIYDLIFYGALSLIVGGRLGAVIFYYLPYFIDNPIAIFKIWEGGMSFHGGLIALIIFGVIFSKIKKVSLLTIGDFTAIPAAIGVFFARIGNFINGELYGRVTEVPWAMEFPAAEGLRHPSQIYEMIQNLIIALVLLVIWRKKNLPTGFLFALYLILYGVGRSITEFFRQPDPHPFEALIDPLTMGQFLSVPMAIVGIILLVYIYKGKAKKQSTS